MSNNPYDFKIVKPKFKYEIQGEAKRGQFKETYYSEAEAHDRAHDVLDDLLDGLEADTVDVGSVTVRKSTNNDPS